MKVADINQVSCVVAGITIESGRGEEGGDFLTIEYLSDAFVETVSLDGEVSRAKTNDRRADVTIKVMSTSDANKYLSALAVLDQNAPNGAGVGAFFAEDRNGLSKYIGAECWITKMPKRTFGQKPVVNEWKIRVANLVAFEGGN